MWLWTCVIVSCVWVCVGQGQLPHSSGTCHAQTLSGVDSGDRHVTPRASWLVPCQGEDYNDHCLQLQGNHPGLTSYSLECAEVPLSIIALASFCLEHECTNKNVSFMLYYMEFVWFSWFSLQDQLATESTTIFENVQPQSWLSLNAPFC